MSRTRGKNTGIRIPRDQYPTPQWCIDLLATALYKIMQIYASTQSFYLCDIGAGDGRIGATCTSRLAQLACVHSVFIDIHKPRHKYNKSKWLIKDFMKVNLTRLFTNTNMSIIFVSNPPFSIADAIVFKTINELTIRNAGIAAFLLRLNWLGSKKRAEWIGQYPPNKLIVLSPRPSFVGTGTDATEYAWFLWTPKLDLGTPITTVYNYTN